MHERKGDDMIGCVMFFPLAGILLAMGAVLGALIISMGAVLGALNLVIGTLLSTMVAISTAFLALWMFILS